jgi:hypothetical protein
VIDSVLSRSGLRYTILRGCRYVEGVGQSDVFYSFAEDIRARGYRVSGPEPAPFSVNGTGYVGLRLYATDVGDEDMDYAVFFLGDSFGTLVIVVPQ